MSSDAAQPMTMTPQDARRLAISRQWLAAARPQPGMQGLMQVMRAIRCLQLDPIDAVARSPLLVLWSRLGAFDPDLLSRALWQERTLFEYWAHAASIVLVEDLPIHRLQMAHWANGGWRPRTRQWIEENRGLREHILERLQAGGPLAPSDFDSETIARKWESSGWTNSRGMGQMLDILWSEGAVMVAGRRGRARLWDLPERILPPHAPGETLSRQQVAERAVQLSLRALGAGTARHIREHFIRGRYPDLDRTIERLVEQGQLRPVQIVDGDSAWPEEWFMHAEDAPLLRDLQNGAWQPRTTLLSPFDNLICDRARTEKLFEFYFRIEIYVPAAKRQFGYYVLPVLHGDRLIGRIDPRFDKPARRLLINAVYAEPHAAGDQEAGKATADAIGELAQFLDAEEVVYQGPVPEAWQGSMPVA